MRTAREQLDVLERKKRLLAEALDAFEAGLKAAAAREAKEAAEWNRKAKKAFAARL